MTNIQGSRGSTPKVLIADDDPGIVRFLADRFAKLGFEVQTVANGLQALIVARRNPPDLLIVDVNMPEVDGLSVCLRLFGPANTGVAVVVATARSDPETVTRCKSFGVYYACKGPEFWNSVRSALNKIFPEMSATEDAIPNVPARAWTRPRVLLVDSDPGAEKFLSSRLEKCGIEILYASDGAKGFRMACKEQPSVIISDCFMPNGDGMYLLTRLRSTRLTENIPFFMMTERPLDEMTMQGLRREICGRPGAARFFSKQFDVRELFVAIQEFCAFDHVPPELPSLASPSFG